MLYDCTNVDRLVTIINDLNLNLIYSLRSRTYHMQYVTPCTPPHPSCKPVLPRPSIQALKHVSLLYQIYAIFEGNHGLLVNYVDLPQSYSVSSATMWNNVWSLRIHRSPFVVALRGIHYSLVARSLYETQPSGVFASSTFSLNVSVLCQINAILGWKFCLLYVMLQMPM